MKVFALVIAVLYFVVAGVEAALIVIAVLVSFCHVSLADRMLLGLGPAHGRRADDAQRKPNFGQLIRIIGPLGFAVVVGANVAAVARHFSLKVRS